MRGLSGEGRVMGSGEAEFAGLQLSRNGESLLARNMDEAVRLAREHPQSGVVVRLEDGEGRPWNPGAITGGRVWADSVPDNVATGIQHGENIPPEILAQQAREAQQLREMEAREEQTVRALARSHDKAPETSDAVRDVAREQVQEKEADRQSVTLP